ncbi:UDP-glucose 4-epimerase GalE [Pseudomonas putida]|uniref:UDP-glucose 4-epimerase n=1 Tax=Pseudomonas putida (strain ATCC 700007 / DSM 6899 / JCM 31910 / BCRC 17059 / LMG 24140 / F1) TaxID=351746 RepID=A5W7C1_PSEP1|nr:MULTISPECIES: UDP-glucose 4-epimerase GalE [Pseudomonas]MDD1998833.1 UDP-glucose 4-epimerase GalE [Pseudomonas putida]MEB3437625.1 UDP-glucose 4-epimerase GalE [Pseudomonas sp. A2]HDS1791500.1 UDP-glucose 4-epimerase GalE [Pseudomonas putida]
MKKILVTGGAGYIGSHTCVELMSLGHEVVIFDNFSNSSPVALERIAEITKKPVKHVFGNILDQDAIEKALIENKCDMVIHFAGLKSVGESTREPLSYYENNVAGTLKLLQAMKNCNVKNLVFSSSATVYGQPQYLPLTENHPLSTTNPYGSSKLIIEEMLRDLYTSDKTWSITILRYFNPVGAHSSGRIGEDPHGIPNNLMPYVAQVAIGKLEKLTVFGDDYDTHDGTGVRDYIHVVDLALGHVKAIEQLGESQCLAINLGTGIGYSVLEVVNAFQASSNREVPYQLAPRRQGDVASCFANAELAKNVLHWEAKLGLEQMCQDHWNWQYRNPKGYN